MSKKKTTTIVETPVVEIVKRGRPTLAGSARQLKLQAQAERVANGGTIHRGRPANPTSKRQLHLAEVAAKVSNGITIRVGRPKKEMVEAPVVEALELIEA